MVVATGIVVVATIPVVAEPVAMTTKIMVVVTIQ